MSGFLIVVLFFVILVINLIYYSNPKNAKKSGPRSYEDHMPKGFIGDGLAPSKGNGYGAGEKNLLDDDD